MALLLTMELLCVLLVAVCISRVICYVLHAARVWDDLKFIALELQGCSSEPERSLPLHALHLALAAGGHKEGSSL